MQDDKAPSTNSVFTDNPDSATA